LLYSLETLMRLPLIAASGIFAIGALAWAGPAEKTCCELWIFEPAGGPDSYAIRSRETGRDYVVLVSPSGIATTLEGDAARAAVRRWTAISQLAASTSVLLDARESRIELGVDVVDEPDAPEMDDADMLVIVRHANRAQARKFINQMPYLTDAARAHLMRATARE
jgi:hypothetical protein